MPKKSLQKKTKRKAPKVEAPKVGRKPLYPGDSLKHMGFRLPTSLVKKLMGMARAKGQSNSDFMRALLEEIVGRLPC
jgi:hypothetical protein